MKFKLLVLVFISSLLVAVLPAAAVVLEASKPVKGTDFPWVVSFTSVTNGDRDAHVCTGSLIDAYTVITAAHCIPAVGAGDWVMLQGRNSITDRGRILTPFKVEVHPDYDPTLTRNDIAVVYLYYPAYSPRYLTIPSANSKYLKGDLFLYGWGDNQYERGTTELRRALQRDASAKAAVDYKYFEPKTQIGANWFDKKSGKYAGACAGDSGGPLVKTVSKNIYLTGVVSYGSRGCNSKAPTVYTKVSVFRDWIRSTQTAARISHSEEIIISTDPFFLTNGKFLPSINSIDSAGSAVVTTTVQLVTGDLTDTAIDISKLSVASYATPQPLGSVSLTAINVSPFNPCAITKQGFLEVRIDIDDKIGTDRLWRFQSLDKGCLLDAGLMPQIAPIPDAFDKCTATMRDVPSGPQVWFTKECFTGAKTPLFRMMLSNGVQGDVEPGMDNWMGPVTLLN